MKVLVNGIGNIGRTILDVLCDYREVLNIDEIYALKNTAAAEWNEAELNMLSQRGVVICSRTNQHFKFVEDIQHEVDYIFDCTANSFGLKNKVWYDGLPNLKGCSAQGSEKGFGVSFMSGINDDQVVGEKFVQVVSCNTHGISSLIMTLVNQDMSNFVEGDFVVVRRSEDIGNHQRLVSANVISRHMDDHVGTHHAIDVKDLFLTRNLTIQVQSSDVTTPSQLLHAVRYAITLKRAVTLEQISSLVAENTNVSSTRKFDSNVIFELGRRYSKYGRIFSHSIINDNNVMLNDAQNVVKGWAFIPQEGNTILSTIHAFLLQTQIGNVEDVFDIIRKDLVRAEW